MHPNSNVYAHLNQSNGTLQLQIDVFCLEILEGVSVDEQYKKNKNKQEKIKKILQVYDVREEF